MPNTNRLRALYLSHLSLPATDRPVYREILRRKSQRILELGIGVGQRAVRMIEVAARGHVRSAIEYTAVDLFEDRSACDGPGVTLKMAHRLLKATGARIQLVPGDPEAALSRVANSLGQVDLMVISRRLDSRRLAGAWFYVPRLLHRQSSVFLEQSTPGGGASIRLLQRDRIEELAIVAAAPRRAA